MQWFLCGLAVPGKEVLGRRQSSSGSEALLPSRTLRRTLDLWHKVVTRKDFKKGPTKCHVAYLVNQGLGQGEAGSQVPSHFPVMPRGPGSGKVWPLLRMRPRSREWMPSSARPRLAGRPRCSWPEASKRPCCTWGLGMSAHPYSGFSLMIPESP